MVPLIINPIYTLYSGYLLDISPLKGSLVTSNEFKNSDHKANEVSDALKLREPLANSASL